MVSGACGFELDATGYGYLLAVERGAGERRAHDQWHG